MIEALSAQHPSCFFFFNFGEIFLQIHLIPEAEFWFPNGKTVESQSLSLWVHWLKFQLDMRIVSVNEYEKRVDLQRSGGWSYFSRDIQWA